jgi:hypothetical protein
MFDIRAASLIEGPLIDSPRNALTLTHDWHQMFGSFKVYFDPVPDKAHTYYIRKHGRLQVGSFRDLVEPRALFLTSERTIEPPSPELLAVHRAISHILHLSAAGGYIDRIYRDIEDLEIEQHSVQEDGSTPLARLVTSALIRQQRLPAHT